MVFPSPGIDVKHWSHLSNCDGQATKIKQSKISSCKDLFTRNFFLANVHYYHRCLALYQRCSVNNDRMVDGLILSVILMKAKRITQTS